MTDDRVERPARSTRFFSRPSLDTLANVHYLFDMVNCGDGPQKLVVLALWHGPTVFDEILRFVSR